MDKIEKKERGILVGLCSPALEDESSDDITMGELEALLDTAGGVCVGKMIQNRETPEAATFIGSGKEKELKEYCDNLEADIVIFDNELSPSQLKNLEEALNLPVIDRAGLILEIFAQRARTSEGKLQVELAQYQYLLPRLMGLGKTMSRLGGGIGTRGPGETKLETDRRHIRSRISKLKEDLAEVRKNRASQRRKRERAAIPVVAAVGYTNAGKSTLVNYLCGSDIQANDRLFDTLDPTTRRCELSDTVNALVSDTVGFIRKLPHNLVEAFKATLEELQYADIIMHVVDVSNPEWQNQMQVTEKMIEELGVLDKPRLTVYNKADKLADSLGIGQGEDECLISARTGLGVVELKQKLVRLANAGIRRVNLLIPYTDAGALERLYREAKVVEANYIEDGISVALDCDSATAGRLEKWMVGGTD